MQKQSESFKERKLRAGKILDLLKPKNRPLTGLKNWDPKQPWQYLFCVILSAQANDDQVNRATQKLFSKFPTLSAVATGRLEQIQEAIKSIGIYKNKAKYLHATAIKLLEKYHGKVPKTLKELTSLPGVGRKTANVYQGVVLGKSEGIAVDTHVARVSQRLGLVIKPKVKAEKNSYKTASRNGVVPGKRSQRTLLTPEQIERQLMKVFPKSKYHLINAAFFWHGREICLTRKPKCKLCKIQLYCPIGIKPSRQLDNRAERE